MTQTITMQVFECSHNVILQLLTLNYFTFKQPIKYPFTIINIIQKYGNEPAFFFLWFFVNVANHAFFLLAFSMQGSNMVISHYVQSFYKTTTQVCSIYTFFNMDMK